MPPLFAHIGCDSALGRTSTIECRLRALPLLPRLLDPFDLAPNLIGQDGLAIERLSDMMFRLTKPYGSTGLASYAATKFALRAFADSLRADEPELRVTTVYPGRIDTDMQRDLVAYEGGTYDVDRFLRPETVAQTVAQVVATPPDGTVHEVVLRPR